MDSYQIGKHFATIVREWRKASDEVIIGQINPAWIMKNIENGWYDYDEAKGFIYWTVKYTGRGTNRVLSHIELEKVAVKYGTEKNGNGQYFLDSMMDKISDLKPEYVELKVMQNNKGAIKFYEKNDFEITGTKEQFEKKTGNTLKMYVMQKILNPINTIDEDLFE